MLHNFSNYLLAFQSETGYDKLEVYEGTSSGKKIFEGDLGRISHQWTGEAVILRWKTDGSRNHASMTAIINVDL